MINSLPKPRPIVLCPFLPSNPKRLPKRKVPMTLVAAFRCQNGGILLCADREEDDGYNKREINKIYQVHGLSDCDVFIAGAGMTGPITRACADIDEVLHKADAGLERKGVWLEHRGLVESSLKVLYKNYPENMKESGGMGLLIIVAPHAENNVPILYRTDRWMLIPESHYAAYGSGKPIADYFAGRLFEFERLEKAFMAILAAFILREAQRTASGVGLGADMVFIHEGNKSLHFAPPNAVKELESGIPNLSDAIFSYWKDHATAPEWVNK